MKLKSLYDAAKEAEAKVNQIQLEMVEHFDSGTEEGKQAALDLRPALDEAKKEADTANLLYISARDAEPEDTGSAARKFVPAVVKEEKPGNTKTRAEFEAMSAADRMTFITTVGNSIVENE